MPQYNCACCLCAGKPEEAIKALDPAAAAGWADSKHTQADADLEPLRNPARLSGCIEEDGCQGGRTN